MCVCLGVCVGVIVIKETHIKKTRVDPNNSHTQFIREYPTKNYHENIKEWNKNKKKEESKILRKEERKKCR